MNKKKKYFLYFKYFLITSIAVGVLFGFLPIFEAKSIDSENIDLKTKKAFRALRENLLLLQNNTLSSINSLPFNSEPVPKTERVRMIITAYSSTPEETDDTPFITAAGTRVREGIVANNLLPFGTKIRIPELYGNKIFVVEDRMHYRKGGYHLDIWFPSQWEAKEFGSKLTQIEVLEN